MDSYLVIYQSGEFDSYQETPIIVTDDEKKAISFVELLKIHIKDWVNEYKKLDGYHWTKKYQKEHPLTFSAQGLNNQQMTEFRIQLGYIINKENVDYKVAYDMYDDYDFAKKANKMIFRKFRKTKPTWNELVKWQEDVADESYRRNVYYKKMEKDRQKEIRNLLLKYPKEIRDTLYEIHRYDPGDGFEIQKVKKI